MSILRETRGEADSFLNCPPFFDYSVLRHPSTRAAAAFAVFVFFGDECRDHALTAWAHAPLVFATVVSIPNLWTSLTVFVPAANYVCTLLMREAVLLYCC